MVKLLLDWRTLVAQDSEWIQEYHGNQCRCARSCRQEVIPALFTLVLDYDMDIIVKEAAHNFNSPDIFGALAPTILRNNQSVGKIFRKF